MSDTTSPTETAAPLEIPNAVRGAAHDALLDARHRGLDLGRASALVIEAVSAPVVAAELRRLAGKIEGELAELIANVCADGDFDGGVLDVVRELRARADELDPA